MTQYYPPEIGAPQNRLSSLALSLKRDKHNVEILTTMPNYPKKELFKKYRNLNYLEEKINNIKITRTSIYIPKNKRKLNLLLMYFSFVFSSIFQFRIKNKKFDYVICESPPLFLGISAFYLSLRSKAKLIFNVSDLWPESAERLGIIKNRIFLFPAYFLEWLIYKYAFLVTCQTKGILNNINKRYPKVKTYWFPNGFDKSILKSKRDKYFPKNFKKKGKKLIIYGGLLGHAQGLKTILRAKKWIRKNYPSINKGLEIVFIGDGPEKDDLQKSNQLMGTNVTFLPADIKSKFISKLRNADACIIPLRKLDIFKGAIPSKIFDALALGIPIILGVDGEARELFIEKANAGIFYEPENHQELAKGLIKIYNNKNLENKILGKNGKAFVFNNFDRDHLNKKLINHLAEKNCFANSNR
ncbi:MAG: glycosyltransferase family 4 protein [Prochlorococcus marinus CUG1435]|nr:glycosyltransferase family 4 protein [Prochlorococcus marinus CUG1435]